MRNILLVVRKEILDNLRDKRSIFFALIYGSLIMPALIFGPLIYGVNKHFSTHHEHPVEVHVIGAERAPNLLQHLHSKNIDTQPAADDFREQLIQNDIILVLEISETYGDNLLAGRPARITLHYNNEQNDSRQRFWRLRGELEAYSQGLAAQRLMVRGFDYKVLQPLDIVENEVSKEEAGAAVIANLVIFLLVLSMTMGGFYLAIDSTAGERERMSLEPLLSLAVSRYQVVIGKYLAILTFVLMALVLPLLVVGIASQWIPDDFFGSASPPGFTEFATVLLLNVPLAFLLTSCLMVIAAFAKSIKEAQTMLGFAMILPMAPFFIIEFLDLRHDATSEMVPVLSQYLLAARIFTDTQFALMTLLPSMLVNLALASLLLFTALRLYQRDAILG